MKILQNFSFLFLLLLSISGNAQENTRPCSSENYKQFDFWVGNWEVFDAENKLIGTNNVVRTPNACAIQENWESKTSPNKGTSYNYFNNSDKKWHQVWIDNSGFILNLEGNFIDGKMVLKSGLIKNQKQNYYNRISWYKENNNVIQIWDYIDEEEKVIQQVFKGIYKKKTN